MATKKKAPEASLVPKEALHTFEVPYHPGETITVPRQLTGRAYKSINQAWRQPRFVGWQEGGIPEFEPAINTDDGYWEALIQACTDLDATWNLRKEPKKTPLMSRTREAINGDKSHAQAFLTLAPLVYAFVMQSDDESAEGNAGGSSETPEGEAS